MMMIDYKEYENLILKRNSTKNFKVTNSYHNKDIWRWIKKNKWLNIGRSITELEFGIIIKTVNKYIQLLLLLGHTIILPYKMGSLEIIKKKTLVEFREGKLYTTRPINWNSTIKLWYEDEESRNNKTLIRVNSNLMFKVHYNKHLACYNNKQFYKFTPTRLFKLCIKNRINNNDIKAIEYVVH